MDNIVFIDVECVGETSNKKYSGKFEVKLFLTHKERGMAARESNKHVSGLSTTPKWDIKHFVAGLKDEWPNTIEAEKLNLSEEQVTKILSIAALSIPIGDPEADILSTIATLNAHILTKPTWWGDGFDLVDYTPVVELHKQLSKLQESNFSTNK